MRCSLGELTSPKFVCYKAQDYLRSAQQAYGQVTRYFADIGFQLMKQLIISRELEKKRETKTFRL